MTKDNVELICDIAELSALFQKTSSLEGFLQKAVSTVAYHMKAAVCSIYLYDSERDELVLRASQGLNPEFVGKLHIKPGEGITGQAFAEHRPIREGDVSRNPTFKAMPEVLEERYRAFLAVPIVRGLSRIGVIAVQDPVADYFDENDTKALRAIAAQLANTIENAELLMSLRSPPKAREEKSKNFLAELKFVKGISSTGGIAGGGAVVLDHLGRDEFDGAAASTGKHTRDDFRRALAQTERQLEELQNQMDLRLADVGALIFSAHLLMLKDAKFSEAMAERIEKGVPASRAIAEVVNHYAALFLESPNPRLREKVHDVKDLGHRLLHNLIGAPSDAGDYRGHVVICSGILPSDLMKLMAQQAGAIILVGTAVTSHVSILARSLQLPMVLAADRRLLELPEDTPVLVDADQGSIFVNPAPEVARQFEALREARQHADEVEAQVMPVTATKDGCRIKLLANVNLLSDLTVAKRLKAEGVGLYRSEFPFIVRNGFPSEEEQYRIYRKIIEEMAGKESVFRTLDIGGDKVLSYFPRVTEANPFLGLRAIRFSLRHKDIFAQQLRALLRAGLGAELQIMFPLISSVDDFLQARDVLTECSQALKKEGIPHNDHPRVGVMIELPSAVEVAEDLAREASFLCIGSNDLVQYMLAVDRTNEQIADLYVPYHPGVLRALARVAAAAQKHNVGLSICGDLATDVRLTPFLLGIGIHTLSMDSRQIPKIQERIMGIDLGEAQRSAAELLRMSKLADIEKRLKDLMPTM